jgi:hypothetical protein
VSAIATVPSPPPQCMEMIHYCKILPTYSLRSFREDLFIFTDVVLTTVPDTEEMINVFRNKLSYDIYF